MKVNEIKRILNAELLVEGDKIDMDILSAFGADLMSDVMAYVNESVLLLTGLINPQVVRTAEMMDIKTIVFVRGKRPGKEIIDLAKEKGITILTTKNTMFLACGKLYEAGMTGRGIW